MMKLFLLILNAIVAGMIKVSKIIGLSISFFSANSCVLPLSALFNGYVGLCLTVLFTAFYSIMFTKKVFALTFFSVVALLRVPTVIASVYLKNKSPLFSLIISTLCISLFLLHPEGYLAAPYALYWIIPPLLSVICKDQFFAQCLSATFLQHAVGSVIFLYRTNMAAAQWYSIIPLVAVERLLLAAGMVIAYHLILYIRSMITQHVNQKRVTINNQLDNKAL